MRLKLILPKVEPNEIELPKECPREGCRGVQFIPRQEVSKKIVDAQHHEVRAWRYECVECGYVFRVYPKGVNHKQISKRVNGMAVMMMNLLGLSYRAVQIVLNSLGLGTGKALDGTNNHGERAIGWWIKGRYRSMRGYNQEDSALGVSRLIAFAGNNLARGLCLADLMA